MGFQVSFVFDSNAIRALGLLSEEDWQHFHSEWKRRQLLTAWIPWNISEVVGTNLARTKAPITLQEIETIQVSVKRFDRLAKRSILPQIEPLLRCSFYQFANVPNPPKAECLLEDGYRAMLETFKSISSAEDILSKRYQDGSTETAFATDYGSSGQVFQPTFQERAPIAIERWKKTGQFRDGASDLEISTALLSEIHEIVESVGATVGVPDSIMRVTRDSNRIKELLETPFALFGFLSQWYQIEHAVGRRPGAPKQNDARDIQIGAYLGIAERLITDEKGMLPKILKRILASSQRVISSRQLASELLGTG